MDAHDRMFGEIAVRLELLTREQLGACRKAQADSAGKRSLPELALSLGMLSDAEIQLVSDQQRKVLDRRREARDSASMPPERPTKPPTRGRTITASGTGGAIVASAQAVAAARDSQPGLRPESRTRVSAPPPIPAQARPASSAPAPLGTAAARRGDDDTSARLEREPTVPRVPHEPRSLIGMGLIVPDLEHTPLDPFAESEARALRADSLPPSAPPTRDERTGKRTEVPPSRARRLANHPPANSNLEVPKPSLGRGLGGALLNGSAQLQRSPGESLRSLAPPEGSLRPAADRGWRNPTRPPPPSQAAARPEPLEVPGLSTRAGSLAWTPSPAPNSSMRPIANESATASAPQPTAATFPSDSRYLDQLLALAVETGASDLHAHSGSPVLARVDGALWPLTADAPLTPPAAEQVIAEIMTDAQWDELQLGGEVRFSYELSGVGRFRAHAYRQAHGLDIVFRALPEHIADPKDLSLPARMLFHVLEARSGLFIVSGPPGSGKTTTLATLTHALANEHNLYVATAESPIEIVHGPGLGMIEQREVPLHAHNFSECIEQAVSLGADVIAVSELSTPSAIMSALQAALSGCAVIAVIQAESPWAALAQLLSHFSGTERLHARAKLSIALKAVYTQHLMPRSSARGRIPAVEMLVGTPQVAQLIADEQLEGIEALMGSQVPGMQTLELALHELARARIITPEVAQRAARRERAEASGT
ncbi:MAG TPA: ATPase, T2SS/T4P/T4SS family [Polyangiales bacterium]|nr:ATPase, T2SS/T4P/T4SS family [Polyangiales bacterium]